jgi:hypothetical protein
LISHHPCSEFKEDSYLFCRNSTTREDPEIVEKCKQCTDFELRIFDNHWDMIGLKGSIKHLRKANAELKYNLEKNTAKLDQMLPLIEEVEAPECERLKNEAKWTEIAPLIAKLQMTERVDDIDGIRTRALMKVLEYLADETF